MIDVTVPLVVGGAAVAGLVVIAPITKYALDMYPYLYANTRCASRAGLLLTKKHYDDLLGAGSIEEVYGGLEDSSYASIVEHHKDFFSFSRGLEQDYVETLSWIQEISPNTVKGVVSALQKRSEINTLKEIMGNLKNKKELPSLVGIADATLRVRIEGIKDMQGFQVALEGSVYGELLASIDLERMAEINTSLDRFYLEQLQDAISSVKDSDVKSAFLTYVTVLIDLFNVRLALRSSGQVSYLEGGVLDSEALASAADNTQLESVFSASVYGEGMSGFSLTKLEQAFISYLQKQAEIIGVKYNLKAGMLLRYLIHKEIEIRNVNALVKLKSEGFDAEEIRSYVVV
ncbi:MAG: V-type ATPase subunit [Nanoarchaeota archaeon]|nr:V-type ATPase subunit [Nanoarchaeota archaeon]